MPLVVVAKVDEIPPGRMKLIEASGKGIMIANLDGKYYVVGDSCENMKARLSMGTLEKNILTCPIPYSRFDITTGKMVPDPHLTQTEELETNGIPDPATHAMDMKGLEIAVRNYDLQVFQVQVNREDILVDV